MTSSRCKRSWLVHVKQRETDRKRERERDTFIDFRGKRTRERETWRSVTTLTDWFSLSDINERLSSDCLSCEHTAKTLRAVRKKKLSNPPEISELMHQTPDSQEVPSARPQSLSSFSTMSDVFGPRELNVSQKLLLDSCKATVVRFY